MKSKRPSLARELSGVIRRVFCAPGAIGGYDVTKREALLSNRIAVVMLVVACGTVPGTTSTGGGSGSNGGGSAGGSSGSTGGGTGVSRRDLVSGTRLKAVVFKGDDGAVAPVSPLLSSYWDTLLETYCWPSSTRCFPYFDSADGYFSDSPCSHPLMGAPAGPYGRDGEPLQGLPLPKVGGVNVRDTDGGLRMEYHQVGSAFTGQVFRQYMGSCTQTTFGPQVLYELGAVVDSSSFARFTAAIDD